MPAYAMCGLANAALRMGASHRSEMGSQLLFGEQVEILEEKGRSWRRVRSCNDDFIGWVPTRQLLPLPEAGAKADPALVLELFHPIIGNDQFLPLTLGAQLPGFDGMRFQLGNQYYAFSGQAVFTRDVAPTAAIVIKIARKLLNAPFLWGGRTPLGIDSAGLTQLAFKVAGYLLPRTPDLQVSRGQAVDFIEQAQPGDLAFFENNLGRITHTGILLPDRQIIHVYEKVRIDAIDHYGIFNAELGSYTHRLRVVRRILPSAPPKLNGHGSKLVVEEVEAVRGLFD